MRILLLSFGSRGDVQPFVALGVALQARGHDVAVSTGAGFEDMITTNGLDAAPLSIDVRALLQNPDIQDAMHTLSGKIKAWRVSKAMIRQQMIDTMNVVRAYRPDIMVYHPKSFVASGMAVELGIPAVPAFLQPAYVPTSAFPNVLLPAGNLGRLGNRISHAAMAGLMRLGFASPLRAWRRAGGAPDMTGWPHPLQGYDPAGGDIPRLHAHSRYLVPKPSDWGHRERITGYWFTDPDPDWTPPSELARFLEAGPPPVYVGFGSMPSKDADTLSRTVLQALDCAGARGILATGWGGLETQPDSDTVHTIGAAPHSWLFPRCAAIVHHGGAGTTHEALRWGSPSIVCPIFGDQPFWARRVADLGAGSAPLPQKRLTAESLAAAIEQTRQTTMIDAAAAVGEKLRSEPGASGAAEIVDGLMTGNGHRRH
jgi:sterol 3beta-glucosyltransferase